MRPYVNPFDVNNFTVVQEIGASPAAGASYIGAVPVNARSQLSLVSCELATDANAANRYIELQLHRGADVYIFANSFVPHSASKTWKYLGFVAADLPTVTVYNTVTFPIPEIPLFLEGDTVRIIVLLVQAADQLDDIRLTWKVWPYEQ